MTRMRSILGLAAAALLALAAPILAPVLPSVLTDNLSMAADASPVFVAVAASISVLVLVGVVGFAIIQRSGWSTSGTSSRDTMINRSFGITWPSARASPA